MSNAAFTDSTTQHASPCLTLRPTLGGSTKTTSVISFCAWSEMPTVPSGAKYSCDFWYFKVFGSSMLDSLLEIGRNVKLGFDDLRGHLAAVKHDRALRSDGKVRAVQVAHTDSGLQRW